MQIKTKAHLAILAANIFYAINFSVMKYVTNNLMQPLALNFLRVVGAAILFWLLWFNKKTRGTIQKKHYLQFILCAATGVLINQILFVKGVSLTTTIRASLLMLVCPIAVVFFAAYINKEKITSSKIIGLLFGLIGATILVSMKENKGNASNILLGDFLIILNALSYALYLVLVKPLMMQYNAILVIRWVFTIALFVILPLGFNQVLQINWSSFQLIDYAAVGFIIIAVTFATYLFTMYGIKILGSSVTGSYIYSQPVFASIIAIIFYNDVHNIFYKIIAAILIFIGVYFVSFKNSFTN